ncbi:MAG: ABC transporter permease subunit [Dehalococcoidia bacterium]|nr:ABC transporter permease subunit [Dehalococcoidia bacterium]
MASGIAPFVTRRLLFLPLALVLVSLFTFAIGRYGPGDPVEVRAGPRADPEAVERIREDLGLDDPFVIQYGRYMGDLLQGDLGDSLAQPGFTVSELVLPALWRSAQLNVVALVIVFGLGIPVGVFAALKRGTWIDPTVVSFFLFFQSVPVVVAIPVLLYVFTLQLGWLPSGGWDGLFEIYNPIPGVLYIPFFNSHLVIPALVLSLPGVAGLARLVRTTTLQVLEDDYVRTARAKGLDELTVVTRHVLRNALLPVTTVVGLAMVGILEGALFTEYLYGIPGVGRVAIEAVYARDYDVIMALTIIGASAFIVVNVLIDIAYTFVDPRVRLTDFRDR